MRTSIPDYYASLELDSKADLETIKAAYYRLMKKFHPDALSAEERDNPAFMRKSQELNEAYAILSDPDKRAYYDNQRKLAALFVRAGLGGGSEFIEKRRYAVRCGTTGKSFHIILARPVEDKGKYRVVGFSPLETLADPQRKTSPLGNLFAAFSHFFRGETEYVPKGSVTPLRMSEVNWSGSRCPACEKAYIAKGTNISTFWVKCGHCQRLSCASTLHDTFLGTRMICTWCHRRIKFTGNAVPGGKSTPMGGLVHKTEEANPYYQGRNSLPPGE